MATPAIVAAGHIHLILSHSTDDFYLEVPIAVIHSNSVHPIKYLRFLGWCVIGRLGAVKRTRGGADIADTAPLQDRRTYLYVYDAADNALKYAVDLEVLKTRSHISTSASSKPTRDDAFKENLAERDVRCIFTSKPPGFCEGTHIIPFHKGDEWLDFIVKNRLADEDTAGLTVDDARNGMLLSLDAHRGVDQRQLVVLQTPNAVLNVGDVPPCHIRPIKNDVKYPEGQRYTIQWLNGDEDERAVITNNSDATFNKLTSIRKPSPMLLHYNYGAAAVRWWGHGKSHLEVSTRTRPIVPVPAAMGPTRSKRNAQQLQESSQKRTKRNMGGSGRGRGGGEAVQEGEAMDPDEIVMYFWSQNPAAIERRKREAEDREREGQDRASRMEQWREGVAAV
ncbi:hypothetical protein DFH09DRAFT_934820 [Mycena vulgaris]|nr:hypothetical protein DFH09DRAFT_934820 [Mycena vulgaris]